MMESFLTNKFEAGDIFMQNVHKFLGANQSCSI